MIRIYALLLRAGPCAVALLLALVSNPARLAAVGPDDFYGMHLSYSENTSAAIPKLDDLGVRWVRVWFNVSDWTSPSANTGNATTQAVALKNAGFKVVFCVNSLNGVVPTYAQAKAMFDNLKARSGLTAAVDVWEIFNELNNYDYWNPAVVSDGPSLYVNGALKAAHDSLRAAGEKVLGGSWTFIQFSGQWSGTKVYSTWETKQFIDYRNASGKGYLDYCDYAGVHPYTDTTSRMQSMMTNYFGYVGTKPVIITEWSHYRSSFSSDTAYMNAMSSSRTWLYNYVDTACTYRFTAGNGYPGFTTYSAGAYTAKEPMYSTYKGWPRASGASLTAIPSADSYIDQANATTNYGANSVLETYKTTTSEKMSYLKFDVSGYAGSAAGSATLKLTRYAADSGISVAVFAGADDSWTESGVTWNTRPDTSSTATDTETVAATVTFDVTAAVNTALAGDKVLTLKIKNAGGTGRAAFYSSEHGTAANRPTLTVTP
ncbi:MAG: DNRLRE domain-containing protein [Opitutaceae bacterium]|nr:DNRLRE domain-containing protein [Opitutaceae bacterium]